jgi:hypothetical protein
MPSHVPCALIGGRITIAWSAHHAGLQVKRTCSSEVVIPMANKCRGCGADIIWVTTDRGRTMPLDAKPEKRFVIDVFIDGKAHRAELVDTYISHFATCPRADEFRKKGGESNG